MRTTLAQFDIDIPAEKQEVTVGAAWLRQQRQQAEQLRKEFEALSSSHVLLLKKNSQQAARIAFLEAQDSRIYIVDTLA